MKLSNVALCLASAATLMLSANTFAAGSNTAGSLHSTGQVLDSTCTISTNELNQVVDLGNIPTADLNVSSGTKVAEKQFDFNLTNCPASLTALGARFNYDADASGNYMQNIGTAQGVLLGISTTHSNDAIASGSTVASEDYDAAGGSATIHAKVNAYRSGTAAPVEGDVTSISQVVIAYN